MAHPDDIRSIVMHYGGMWGISKPGDVKLSDYKGGKKVVWKVDADYLNWIDFSGDITRDFLEGVVNESMYVAYLLDGERYQVSTDSQLTKMWSCMKKLADNKYHVFVSTVVPALARGAFGLLRRSPRTSKPSKPTYKNVPKAKKIIFDIDDTNSGTLLPHTSESVHVVDDALECLSPLPSTPKSSLNLMPRRSPRLLSPSSQPFGSSSIPPPPKNNETAPNSISSWDASSDIPNSQFLSQAPSQFPSQSQNDFMSHLSQLPTKQVQPESQTGHVMGDFEIEVDLREMRHNARMKILDEDLPDRPEYCAEPWFGMTVDDDDGRDYVSTDGEYDPKEDELDEESDDEFVLDEEELLNNDNAIQFQNVFADEDNEKGKELEVNEKVPDMSEGMCWATMKECRQYFKTLAVTKHFNYGNQANDKKRYRLICKDNSCEWFANCRKMRGGDCTIVLKTYNDKHSCKGVEKDKNKHAMAPWVAKKCLAYFKAHPLATPREIKSQVYADWGAQVTYWTAWTARKMMMTVVNGNYEDSFALCPELMKQINISNPGSIVKCFVDGNEQFEGFFVSYKACLEGWTKGCRPIVGLDGCHLKGKYEGVCLSAIGIDGNNGLYPLAIYITRKECHDSWYTFLALLEKDLKKRTLGRDGDCLTFFSDRQKGLVKAVHEIFPNAYQRFCFRHMISNYKSNGFKGEHLVNLAWAAAKAFKQTDHEKIMEMLKNENIKAKEYLEKEPVQTWARCFFDKTSKCEYSNNNFSESFNNWILEVRTMPIVKLVDKYTLMLSKQFYDRKLCSQDTLYGQVLVPRVVAIIESLEKKYFRYTVQGINLDLFLVTNRNQKKFHVDITKHTCTCNEWQMSGIPCVHAIAVVRERREGWAKWCSPWFTVSAYQEAYRGYIVPFTDVDDWAQPDKVVHPPPRERAPGRPQTQRIRGEHEPVKASSKSVCSKCKKVGHNKRTCDARNDPSKVYKRKLNKYKRNEMLGIGEVSNDGASTSMGRGGGGPSKRGRGGPRKQGRGGVAIRGGKSNWVR